MSTTALFFAFFRVGRLEAPLGGDSSAVAEAPVGEMHVVWSLAGATSSSRPSVTLPRPAGISAGSTTSAPRITTAPDTASTRISASPPAPLLLLLRPELRLLPVQLLLPALLLPTLMLLRMLLLLLMLRPAR